MQKLETLNRHNLREASHVHANYIGIWPMTISQNTSSANSRQEEILKMVFVENFSKGKKVEIKE